MGHLVLLPAAGTHRAGLGTQVGLKVIIIQPIFLVHRAILHWEEMCNVRKTYVTSPH